MSTDADYWRDRCSQAETKAELLQEALDSANLDLTEARTMLDDLKRDVSGTCANCLELLTKLKG